MKVITVAPCYVAVIPCYNEQGTIASVVKAAMKFVDAVYVPDDNSIDNTVYEADKSMKVSVF